MNLSDKIHDTDLPYIIPDIRQIEYRFPFCTPATRIDEFLGMFSDCYPEKPLRALWDFGGTMPDHWYIRALQATKESVPNLINDISINGMLMDQVIFNHYHFIVQMDDSWLDMVHLNRAVLGRCLMIIGQPIKWCDRNKEWVESVDNTSDQNVTFFPSRGHALTRL